MFWWVGPIMSPSDWPFASGQHKGRLIKWLFFSFFHVSDVVVVAAVAGTPPDWWCSQLDATNGGRLLMDKHFIYIFVVSFVVAFQLSGFERWRPRHKFWPRDLAAWFCSFCSETRRDCARFTTCGIIWKTRVGRLLFVVFFLWPNECESRSWVA